MSKMMDKEKLQALAQELAKDLKTPADLSNFSAQLTKLTVEAALNAEMDNHASGGLKVQQKGNLKM